MGIPEKKRRLKLLRIEQLKREQSLITQMTDQEIIDEISSLETQMDNLIDQDLGEILFKANKNFSTKLNQGIIPEKLKKRFEVNKIELNNPSLSIITPNIKWEITEGTNTYCLIKEIKKIEISLKLSDEIKTERKKRLKEVSRKWGKETLELHM